MFLYRQPHSDRVDCVAAWLARSADVTQGPFRLRANDNWAQEMGSTQVIPLLLQAKQQVATHATKSSRVDYAPWDFRTSEVSRMKVFEHILVT